MPEPPDGRPQGSPSPKCNDRCPKRDPNTSPQDSGFGKFAGVEGLRGLCVTKAVVTDLTSLIRTSIPPPLCFPLKPSAFGFTDGLIRTVYGHSLSVKVGGVLKLLRALLPA